MGNRDLVLPSLGCTTSEQKVKTESSMAMRGRRACPKYHPVQHPSHSHAACCLTAIFAARIFQACSLLRFSNAAPSRSCVEECSCSSRARGGRAKLLKTSKDGRSCHIAEKESRDEVGRVMLLLLNECWSGSQWLGVVYYCHHSRLDGHERSTRVICTIALKVSYINSLVCRLINQPVMCKLVNGSRPVTGWTGRTR